MKKTEWSYINSFNFAGKNYNQWIRMISQNSDGSYNFEHKTELATIADIKKAEENSVRFYQYLPGEKEDE